MAMTGRPLVVNLAGRYVITDDGGQYPITRLYDAWGDETDEITEAIACVAGAGQMWLNIALPSFATPRVLH